MLFTTTPSVRGANAAGESADFTKWFIKTITVILRTDNLARTLPVLLADTRARFDDIAARSSSGGSGGSNDSCLLDPFDEIYAAVYQLMMRIVGADNIARSPELLCRTLRLFESIEASNSPARIIFPWLWTPAYLRRTVAGARLYQIFSSIAEGRRKSGTKGDDALQFLVDGGDSMLKILAVSQMCLPFDIV